MTVLKRLLLTAGIVLLNCSLAFAQSPYTKFSYWSNFGGLNDQLSATEIADNEASDIQNIVFDTGGALKKRYGFLTIPRDPLEKVSTGSVVCVNGLAFFRLDDDTKYIVAIANNDSKATAMARVSDATTSWVNIDFNQMPSNFTNNDLVDFAVAENKLVITIPASLQVKPFVWTGTTKCGYLTIDTDCPASELVEYHKNHLFLSGNDVYPSRVYFSALDDITDYTATDFFDVSTSDGSRTTALISAYGSLYIFKDYSIWRLSGYERDTFVLEKMVDGIGTRSTQSVKMVNNFIHFTTAQNDIAVYDGGYNVVFNSQKIRNTIGDLNFSRSNRTLGLAFSTYKYNDNDYYCSVSTAGSDENDRVLLFDTAFKAWTKFAGIKANAWCVSEDSVGKNLIVFGDYDGYVHTYPSTTYYDGNVQTSPISAFYQTKWFRYSDLCLGDKYWRVLKTYALSEANETFLYAECSSDYEQSGKIISFDLGEAGALWDSAIWDIDVWSGQTLIVNRAEIDKGTNMFQVKFYNEDVDKGFTLFGFDTMIEPTERD